MKNSFTPVVKSIFFFVARIKPHHYTWLLMTSHMPYAGRYMVLCCIIFSRGLYRTNGQHLHSGDHGAVRTQNSGVLNSDVARDINTPLNTIVCSCVSGFSNNIVVRYHLDTFSLLGVRGSLLDKEGWGGRNKADWGKRGRQRSRIILIPSRWLMWRNLCQCLPWNHYPIQIVVCCVLVKIMWSKQMNDNDESATIAHVNMNK